MIFVDQVQARERYVQARPLGIFEQQEIFAPAACLDLLDTQVLSYAVLRVNDRVPHAQVLQVREEGRACGLARARPRKALGAPEDILGAVDRKPRFRQQAAVRNRRLDDDRRRHVVRDAGLFFELSAETIRTLPQHELEGHLVFAEQVGETLEVSEGRSRDQHAGTFRYLAPDFLQAMADVAFEARDGPRANVPSRFRLAENLRT